MQMLFNYFHSYVAVYVQRSLRVPTFSFSISRENKKQAFNTNEMCLLPTVSCTMYADTSCHVDLVAFQNILEAEF